MKMGLFGMDEIKEENIMNITFWSLYENSAVAIKDMQAFRQYSTQGLPDAVPDSHAICGYESKVTTEVLKISEVLSCEHDLRSVLNTLMSPMV